MATSSDGGPAEALRPSVQQSDTDYKRMSCIVAPTGSGATG